MMSDMIKKLFQDVRNFFVNMGERGVLLICVIGIVVLGTLIWALTTGLRNRVEIDMVNRYLSELGEERRIERPIRTFGVSGKATQSGSWWMLTSREKAVIFPLIVDGVFSPCLGIIDRNGTLERIIPLTKHAERMIERSKPGMLTTWINRLEKSAALLVDL